MIKVLLVQIFVFVLTYPDTDNHEEKRLDQLTGAYTEICPEFKEHTLRKCMKF